MTPTTTPTPTPPRLQYLPDFICRRVLRHVRGPQADERGGGPKQTLKGSKSALNRLGGHGGLLRSRIRAARSDLVDGIHSGLPSKGLDPTGLYTYGLYSYVVMAYIVMAALQRTVS